MTHKEKRGAMQTDTYRYLQAYQICKQTDLFADITLQPLASQISAKFENNFLRHLYGYKFRIAK